MTTFGDLKIHFEPLYEWPGVRTKRPAAAPFRTMGGGRTPWSTTLEDLRRELDQIRAKGVVIQAFLPPSKIRNDGLPYSNAVPSYPGVILSIEDSKQGRLRFPCDTFNHWHDNVRAIALSMEALRKVDRYGVTKGAQYKGLPGAGGTAGSITANEAANRLVDLARSHTRIPQATTVEHVRDDRAVAGTVIKSLMKVLHPDIRGETTRDWHLFTEAKHALEKHHGAR